MKLAPAAALLASLATAVSAASINGGLVRLPLHARASTCNGDAALCNKKYSNVTFIGSHNSYATSNDGNIATEQTWNISQQLQAGVRMLQAQTHTSNSSSGSGIHLCHSSCNILDGGSLEDWLGEVKTWADQNPREVLSLLLVNEQNISPSKFATAFKSSGVDSLSWQPSGKIDSKSQWPTLSSMLDSGKRIVTFLSAGAGDSVPYLLSEFSYIWETPYDQTSVPFNCSIDRQGKGSSAKEQMYLSNHYKDQTIVGVTAPDKSSATSVNSQQAVLQNADSCAKGAGGGAYPNFMLIDFVGAGNGTAWQGPFQAAAQMNGISYSAPHVANSSATAEGNTSPSASGRLVPLGTLWLGLSMGAAALAAASAMSD